MRYHKRRDRGPRFFGKGCGMGPWGASARFRENSSRSGEEASRTRPGGGPYRSRNGLVMGVVRGLAEHLNISVKWSRIAVAVIAIGTGIWAVAGIYILAGLLMKPEPVMPFENQDEEEFYNSYTDSRGMAIGRLKKRFDSLDRRIRRMEDVVTSRDFEWEQKMTRS